MITLASPAKVNVFLKILGKREDGYHEIVSLFQTISLADTLTIRESRSDICTCSHPMVPTSFENTVIKTLNLFRKKSNIQKHFNVHIEKKIPIGAGLGGGSSNAATALFGFNSFLKNPLPMEELHIIAQEVGSDVPFFLSLGSAVCRGRGEIVEEVMPQLSGPLSIAMPPFSLSTKSVYQTLDCASLKPRTLPKKIDYAQGKREFFNDLEDPAFKLSPELKKLKQYLLTFNKDVFMTGSGSALVILGGEPAPESHANYTLYKAHFITREEGSWYPFHKF